MRLACLIDDIITTRYILDILMIRINVLSDKGYADTFNDQDGFYISFGFKVCDIIPLLYEERGR